MEQKINKRERWKSVLLCVCVCERRKERAGEREKESALVRDGLAALEDASSLFLLRLRQENPLSRAHEKEKKKKKKKKKKLRTNGGKGKKKE